MSDKKSGNSNIVTTAIVTGVATAAIGGLLYLFRKDSNQPQNNYSHGERRNNPAPQSNPLPRTQPKILKSTTKNNTAATGRENIDTCSYCLEDLFTEDVYASSPVEIPCNHYFHLACISKWCTKNRTCPICCTVIPKDLKAIYF